MQAYQSLEELFTEVYRYTHFLALASWDSQVNAPPGTYEARAEAVAQLERHIHHLLTADQTRAWLSEATRIVDGDNAAAAALSFEQRANLREMTRVAASASALPVELLARRAALSSTAQATWVRAREENNYSLILPTFRDLVAIAREEAAWRRETLPTTVRDDTPTAYDALLDGFEPGMTSSRLDELFAHVMSWLPGLLREVLMRQAQEDERRGAPPPLLGPFPVCNQEGLARYVMERVWHFDFARGRLDESTHPFTGNVKEDCRVTTTYVEDSFLKSLFATIHEVGHASYKTHLGPSGLSTQPVCAARSCGIDESQAIFAEKCVGHSSAFASFLLPALREYFPTPVGYAWPTEISGLTEEGLRRVVQRVEPGYIRIDADEVCYPLHVILRYEMERDLMEGKLEADDVPRVWNGKMKQYLGLETLGRDDLGCLQDIHWSVGAFGYFPTYGVGIMFAAQLMATIRKELGPDTVDHCLRTGELGPIFAKQKEKIWDHGSTLTTDELMIQATGEKLNPEYLRQHLERRYLRRED